MAIFLFTQRVIVISVIVSNSLFAQQFQWASGMTGAVTGKAVAKDNSGNIYVTGYFSGTAKFGNGQITSSGGEDIFLAKYNANGNILWVRKAGSTLRDRGNDISVDNSGNIYITGSFEGTANFSSSLIMSSGKGDIFVAKYDADGYLRRVIEAGGASQDEGSGISVDNSGNCYVTGFFSWTATFGLWDLSSYGYEDIFVAKCNANGFIEWVRKAGGMTHDQGNGLSTDNAGNSYLTGFYSYTATFGNIQISGNGDLGYSDIFIAKYNSYGSVQWVQKAGGYSEDIGYDISIDISGNSYVTGCFKNTATFGTSQISSNGAEDIFTAKYHANGNLLWVRKAGGTSSEYCNDISADNSGNCYVTGYFKNTATFGTTQITSSGAEDIFTAKYDASGDLVWVKKIGATSSDYGRGISADNAGNCYVTGSFTGSVSFGSIILNNGNGFVTKISAVTDIKELAWEIPTQFTFAQNYPNPFNPSTVIRFSLPISGNVILKVYNSLGETVQTLVNEFRNAGTHEVCFNASGLSSGFYLYEIKSRHFSAVRKMLLMK
jgi:hypothetical protein